MSHQILILEDSVERIRTFQRKFIGHVLFITGKADEAIEWLYDAKYSFDQIYLDHDLDNMSYADPDRHDNTGSKVIRRLCMDLNNNYLNIPITIHSHNALANFNMRSQLLKAGYISYSVPFWQIKGENYNYELDLSMNNNVRHLVNVIDQVKDNVITSAKTINMLRGINENNT